jgi:hypothetical protein
MRGIGRALCCGIAAIRPGLAQTPTSKPCKVDGPSLVEFARSRGRDFTAALTSPDGSCLTSNGALFIVSAGEVGAARCSFTFFTSARIGAPPEIIAIHIVADPGTTTLYPAANVSPDSVRTWHLSVEVPPMQTVQFRVDTVEVAIEDCKKWKTVF